MQTREIVILTILSMVLLLSIFLFYFAHGNYKDCQNSENPACPTYSCGQEPNTTHEACRGDPYDTAFVPYRVADDGSIMCQGIDLSPVIYRNQ